ncbi:Lachesin [Armadillidium nasatum]|uniref:Lachesin n=1 Tax=Armadillidium nasatum TaxID=96803 RepID=A0A5N5T5P8_9CRUS|nr:Lachesin [Armadillidium nasatum]
MYSSTSIKKKGNVTLITLPMQLKCPNFDTKNEESDRQLPYFIEPIPNKTVVVGRDVAWIFVETQTILTIHHTIITKNPRFSLARHDHKHWYLQISDVKPSDRGLYMCQVNSDPMMSQVGFLDVQVKVSDSEVLHIPKVSRLHMGAYLCIASNNVPPSVSKRITLKVQFAPVLWIPNQLVGVSQGMDITLECHTEAFPRSINYWTDNRGLMILSKDDRFDSIVAENGYKSYMRLKIKGVTKADYGTFGCTAKNSFGESNGTIKVYELPRELLINAPYPDGNENSSNEDNGSKRKRKKNDMNGRSREQKKLGEKIDEDFSSMKDLINGSVSTMTPDGVINFDVQRLYKKNRGRKQNKPKMHGGDFMQVEMPMPPSGKPREGGTFSLDLYGILRWHSCKSFDTCWVFVGRCVTEKIII